LISDCFYFERKSKNQDFKKEELREQVFASPTRLFLCSTELKQKAFEPLFIPTRESLLPLNNKGGVFSNPMTKGFIDSQRRLDINKFDEETMFMEPVQFPDPVGGFHILLLQA